MLHLAVAGMTHTAESLKGKLAERIISTMGGSWKIISETILREAWRAGGGSGAQSDKKSQWIGGKR